MTSTVTQRIAGRLFLFCFAVVLSTAPVFAQEPIGAPVITSVVPANGQATVNFIPATTFFLAGYSNTFGVYIDGVTGLGVNSDGSEFDPYTNQTIIPAPTVAQALNFIDRSLTVLTLDASTGQYTTFDFHTIDFTDTEYDFYGNTIGAIDPSQIVCLTTNNTYVFLNDIYSGNTKQYDPINLIPTLTGAPFTIMPTPPNFSAINAMQDVSGTPGPYPTSIAGYSVTATPGGATVSGQNSPLTVTGLTNGQTYRFIVTATDIKGDTISSGPSEPVTFNVPVINASGPTTFCAGGGVTLTANTQTADYYTYLWNTGETTKSINVGTSGVYSVTISTNNVYSYVQSYSSTSAPVTVNVSAFPVGAITASGPTTFCQGSSVTLKAMGSDAGSVVNWGDALNLDGYSGFVDVPPTSAITNLGKSGYTLEAWIKPSDINDIKSIVRKDGDYNFYLNQGTVAAEVWVNGTGYPTMYKYTGTVQNVTVGTWTHVAATWNATTGTMSIYINGVAIPTTKVIETVYASGNFLIGVSQTYGQPFAGEIDELRIWNTPITQTQITNSIGTLIPNNSPGLVAYYKFDEGAGTTTTDATGNGNNGTLQSGASWVVPSDLPAPAANTYLWSTGETTPAINVTTSGTYTLTVSNASGCTAVASQVVTVNPLIMATITPSGPTTFCRGGFVTLTGSLGTGTIVDSGYLWSDGETSPVIIVGTTGNYSVTVTNASGCSSTSKVTMVIVNPLPEVSISANGPTSFCEGSSVILTASAGSSYLWSTGATTQSIIVSTSGVYRVVVNNAQGCSSEAFASVEVQPLPPPTISASGATTFCPSGSVTLTASAGASYLWSNGATTPAITVGTTGNYSVTVTNASGCSSTSPATAVLVQDNVSPVFTSTQANVTVALDAVTGKAVIADYTETATATDNCSVASITQLPVAGTPLVGNTPTTVILTATDPSGKKTTQSLTVPATDQSVPIAKTKNITVSLNPTGNAAITPASVDNGSTDNVGIVSYTLDNSTFNCANVGLNTVNLTVTDAAGNHASASAVVTVQDTTKPKAITKNLTVQLDATGKATITPAQVDNGSSDNCNVVTFDLDKTTFDCSNVGANTVTLFVSDSYGNHTSATATVTVQDVSKPVFTSAQANVTVALDAVSGKAILANYVSAATATDNCSALITQLPAAGTSMVINVPTTVTLTATDPSGNYTTQSFTVTATDQTPPVVLTKNITVSLDANGSAVITSASVNNGSTDNVGIASYSLDKTSFNCANVGPNTVTLTVKDAAGNTSAGIATVTVQDNTAPIAIAQNVTVQLDATGKASVTAAQVNNGSTDNCGIASIALSNTAFDCSAIGANTVTLTVTDIHGNVSTCTAVVTVQDKIAPTVLTKNITVQLGTTGSVTITTAMIDNGSTDNCTISTYALSKSTFDSSNVGANTITLTVTDKNGNVSTGTAVVTVQNNNIPPTITQPLNQQICFAANGTYMLPALVATDNSGIASITYTLSGATMRTGTGGNASGLLNTGLTTITWKVTDKNGNSSTASNTIQIWPLPVVSITPNSPDSYCSQVILTANSNIAAATYQWTLNNGLFATTPTISLGQMNADGVYSLHITDIHGCTNTAVASYTFTKQSVSNDYTILAYKEVDLGQNNMVVTGSVGIMSASGDVDMEKGSAVASIGAFVKSPRIDIDKTANVPNRIYSMTAVTLPTMYYNTANTNGLPNYEVKSGTVTLNGNYGNVNIDKGAVVTLTGTVFGTIHIQQAASLRFTSATVSINQLNIDEGPKTGYTYVYFMPNTNVLVSGSVNIGSHSIINPDNYKVTFYIGLQTDKFKDDDDWSDAAKFSVNGGDVKIIANVNMPTGKLRINSGEGSDDDNNDCWDPNANKVVSVYTYMTGLFIAAEVEGGGKNVLWNNYNCSATPTTPLAGTNTYVGSSMADTALAPAAKPVLKLIAYPNPFGKHTTVSFRLPVADQHVTLDVFNTLGNKTDALYRGSAEANITYEYPFDGTRLAPGMYFIKLTTSTGVQTFKLLMTQ